MCILIKYIIVIIYSIITAIVAASPFLFIDFKVSPIPGPGMAIFIPHALVSVDRLRRDLVGGQSIARRHPPESAPPGFL